MVLGKYERGHLKAPHLTKARELDLYFCSAVKARLLANIPRIAMVSEPSLFALVFSFFMFVGPGDFVFSFFSSYASYRNERMLLSLI